MPPRLPHSRFPRPTLRFSTSYFLISNSRALARSGFALLELMVVIGIVALLMVLLVPAVTSLKGAGDITNSAYTIKGLLEQARAHALINNTYTWVGFFEENGAIPSTNPPTAGTGRVVISTVASKDGTIAYEQPVVSPSTPIDPGKLAQVSKLIKLDYLHLRTFPNGTGTGVDSFLTRPPIPGTAADNAKIGDTSPPESLRPFQYPVGSSSMTARYTFAKMIEFSPRGECRVNNINFAIRALLEVAFQPVRGTVFDANKSHAIQVNGFGGNIKLYRP